MQLEPRTRMYNGKFSFDVVDTDDSIDYDGQTYPESIFTSGDYANELTADRNADKWIKSFNSATKSEKSRMLGYTWNPDCEAVPQPVPPVRRARP